TNDVITQRSGDDIALKTDIINDNLIKNSNFKLNTNGLSEYADVYGETLNKWIIYSGTVKKNESGITLTRGSDVDLVFFQQLDHNQFPVGNTYTFSVCMLDGTAITHSFVLTSYEMSTAQILLGNNFYADVTPINGNLTFRIFALAGATEINVEHIKLEIGTIATEYVEPDIEIEKVRCGVYGDGKFASSGNFVSYDTDIGTYAAIQGKTQMVHYIDFNSAKMEVQHYLQVQTAV
ncbi:MAG: hypothetical protein J6J86_10205, partial [Lachnospiraceae bacterium]|nr:hypothetical protein [Lachnospiraceae bacterium]